MRVHYEWSARKINETKISRTLCGLKDEKLLRQTTLKADKVDCKNCLKLLNNR